MKARLDPAPLTHEDSAIWRSLEQVLPVVRGNLLDVGFYKSWALLADRRDADLMLDIAAGLVIELGGLGSPLSGRASCRHGFRWYLGCVVVRHRERSMKPRLEVCRMTIEDEGAWVRALSKTVMPSDLAENLRDSRGQLSANSLLCQQAAQLISTQRDQIDRYPKEQFRRYFCAALNGLLVSHPCTTSTAVTSATIGNKIIGEAAALARIASRRSLGEDS